MGLKSSYEQFFVTDPQEMSDMKFGEDWTSSFGEEDVLNRLWMDARTDEDGYQVVVIHDQSL